MNTPPESQPDIVRFYRGEQTDQSGRLVSEILSQGDEWLEFTHDYIQWLFPLTEASAFNPDAPVLTPSAIAEFRSDPALGERLQQAYQLMLGFYGFQSELNASGGLKVTRSAAFEPRAKNWLTSGNHNHLRITRILKSLGLLGLRPQADAFLACLLEVNRDYPRIINANTLNFWRNAVK